MTLQVSDVKRVTREILDEYGTDYVYPMDADGACTYSPNEETGSDGCLIGLIVKRLDPEAYEMLKDTDAGVGNAQGIHAWYPYGSLPPGTSLQDRMDLIGQGIIQTSNEVATAMWRAQSAQDSGQPWGEAAQIILDATEATA